MNNINFFSPYIEKKKKVISTWSRVIVYSILIVLVIGSFYFITNETIKDLEIQIQSKKNYIESEMVIKKSNEILKLKEELINDQENYTIAKSIEKELLFKERINTELMDTLQRSRTDGIFDLYTSISTEEIFIEGLASSKTEIAHYEKNLRKSNLFKNVHVSKIIRLTEPENRNDFALNYRFYINCIFIGDKNETE